MSSAIASPGRVSLSPRPPKGDWYHDWLAESRCLDELGLFFIGGCQKSGTTWVQVLLNAHPNLCCQGEGHFTDLLAPHLQRAMNEYNRAQVDSARFPAKLTLTVRDLYGMVRTVTDRILTGYVSESGKAAPRDGAGAPSRGALAAVGDKTPECATALGALSTIYPRARFIHVIRDGRDGAVSGWAHLERQNQGGRFATFADYAEYFAEHHWVHYIREARVAAAAFPDRFLEVFYEQLHADPTGPTRQMLEFLGVDSGDDAVRICVENSAFEKLSGGRARGEEKRDSHFRKGLVGDWRNHFNAEASARFEAKAGPLMRQLGYA